MCPGSTWSAAAAWTGRCTSAVRPRSASGQLGEFFDDQPPDLFPQSRDVKLTVIFRINTRIFRINTSILYRTSRGDTLRAAILSPRAALALVRGDRVRGNRPGRRLHGD